MVGEDGEVVQAADYLPSGIATTEYEGLTADNHLHTGEEFDSMHGLHWYDNGARWMDPIFHRFTTMDPLAEKYYSISPYAVCANNPLKYIDYNEESINLIVFQWIDDELHTNYVEQIIKDLSAQTGLTYSLSSNGNLAYAKDTDGNPIIATTKDNDGNISQVGSASARDLMMGAIDHPDMISVEWGTRSSTDSDKNRIGLKIDQINGFIEGSVGIDNRTMGFGMTLMHEIQHTQVGGGLSDEPMNPGPVVTRMNKIRKELNA